RRVRRGSPYSRSMPTVQGANGGFFNRWIQRARSRVSIFTTCARICSALSTMVPKRLFAPWIKRQSHSPTKRRGGAQKLLESAIDYSKLRVQFGREIGSFQAIKHKLADMLLDVELAKSSAYYAAQAAAIGDPEWPALANLAKAAVSDTYLHTAAQTIQIHGGIGFTWENDTHLWFKRAKSSEVFLGLPSYHRELLMQRWGV